MDKAEERAARAEATKQTRTNKAAAVRVLKKVRPLQFTITTLLKDPVAKKLPKDQLDSVGQEVARLTETEKNATKAVSDDSPLGEDLDTVDDRCGLASNRYKCMSCIVDSLKKFHAK